MEVVPNLKLITEGKVVDDLGITRPIIEVKVIPGESSDQSKIGYSWEIVRMSPNALEI